MNRLFKQGLLLLCAALLLSYPMPALAAEAQSVEPEIVPLAAGYLHSAIIREDGTLWTSGSNVYGQLGVTPENTGGETSSGSGQAVGEDSAVFVQTMENVRAVYTRYLTTFAIDNNNTLYGWGWNEGAQLGLGDSKNRSLPTQILSDVATAAPGRFHSAAVTTDGTLWTWGWNDSGQLGNGNTNSLSTPKEALTGVRSVALGLQHTMVVKSDNTLWAAGHNAYGQLANGETENLSTFEQVMTDVQSVACTSFGTLILKTNGTLWACGYNATGELGNGTYDNIFQPVEVLSGVAAVSCGENFSAAIDTTGVLYVWGNNDYGQYGSQMSPFPAELDKEVTHVSLGGGHMLYLTEDGIVHGIGNNEKGQLGNDSHETTDKAVIVADDVAAVPRARSSNTPQIFIGLALLLVLAAAVAGALLYRKRKPAEKAQKTEKPEDTFSQEAERDETSPAPSAPINAEEEAPEPSVEKPTEKEEAPEPSVEKPAEKEEAPEPSVEKPAEKEEAPEPSVEKPTEEKVYDVETLPDIITKEEE